MVDIKWAQDNCSVNIERLERIEADKKWLEGKIDEIIKHECRRGKRSYWFCPDYCDDKRHTGGLVEDAIKEVANKYKTNGYDVKIDRNCEGIIRMYIEW